SWVSKFYPWIWIIYVLAGCTGKFQPCNVGIQHVLKLGMKHGAHADIVEEALDAYRGGMSAEDLLLDRSLPTLQDQSFKWVMLGHEAINHPDLVKQ
ncbi:hypothetical protein BS47DRAFT_1252113, partial [Hydnum rufescens UP504]